MNIAITRVKSIRRTRNRSERRRLVTKACTCHIL